MNASPIQKYVLLIVMQTSDPPSRFYQFEMQGVLITKSIPELPPLDAASIGRFKNVIAASDFSRLFLAYDDTSYTIERVN